MNEKSGFYCKVKNRLLVLLLGVVLFLSCQKSDSIAYGEGSLISGLATPIALSPDSTWVYLSDYFDFISEIEEITAPVGIQMQVIDGDMGLLLLIAGPETTPMSVLTVRSKSKHDYHLLLKRSFSQLYELVYQTGELEAQNVRLAGDMNSWNPAMHPLVQKQNAIWSVSLQLTPGFYAFQMEVDGKRVLHPDYPIVDNGMGGHNSLLEIKGAADDELPYTILASVKDKTLSFEQVSAPGRIMVFWENTLLLDSFSIDALSVKLPKEALKPSRSYVRVYSYNENGLGNDLLIPLHEGEPVRNADLLTRTDFHAQIMYFLMVDRFVNGDPKNDRPENDPLIHPLANFKGGDLAGVIQKLQDAYFEELGINTLWLSPIPKNPEGSYGLWDQGGVKSTFSAYHGYWPIGLDKVDARFGTEDELRELIALSHQNEMNVILDFVAHHIHEAHPIYAEKKDQNWFTDLYLPDGSLNTERWDEHRLTTWFDVFLPTFNFFNPEVVEMISDTAMYWLHEFGVDGFRHDATKHVHLDFWRALTAKVKKYSRKTNRSVYQVGETYGSPELIASYISTGMLDAQFDFNLFDAAIEAICKDDMDFQKLAARLQQSLKYYGYNHLMGNMSGNQDRARFMSYATGDISFEEDAKLAGWTRDIEKRNEEGFRKLAMMHAFNLNIPGVPCIYYGDEIGMTGGNDPDNRRMMYFEQWSPLEASLFQQVRQLNLLRKNNLALLYGDLRILSVDDPHVFVFCRRYLDQWVLFALHKGKEQLVTPLTIPSDIKLEEFKILGDGKLIISEKGATLIMEPLSYMVAHR